MNEKINLIIEELKVLTLLEAAELVNQIEETFGVDASASVSANTMAVGTMAEADEQVEEKTEFTVRLDKVPTDNKVPILKIVRTLTGLGLKDAKGLVDSAPKDIQTGITKEAAEESKKQLEGLGASVSLT